MARKGDVAQGAGGVEAGSRPVDPVAGKTVAEILGEIVWLMTQDPAGRAMKVAEIEALVMPAITAKRFHFRFAQVPDMRRPGATTLQPVEVGIFTTSAASNNQSQAVLRIFSVPQRIKRSVL